MLLLLIFSLAVGMAGAQRPSYPDLQGPYCATRPNATKMKCCEDRRDPCSVPILGTLCYCDEFCDRGPSGDCCPDYFSFCLGEVEPLIQKSCSYNGKTYSYGEKLLENCNFCACAGEETAPEMECEEDACLVEPPLVDILNQYADLGGWNAANYSQFWGKKLRHGELYLLGTDYPHKLVDSTYPVTKTPMELPDRFDAREKWPGLVGGVVDQDWCGASWAVSTATVASDRFSIQQGRRTEFSIQNIMDCAVSPTKRHCVGGRLDSAWSYLRLRGVTEEGCYPYTSRITSDPGLCLTKGDKFSLTCRNGSTETLGPEHLHRMQPPYRISGERDIMQEIYTAGPVQAVLRVYRDLFLYRSGVYWATANTDHEVPYHSVRILGWGEQTTGSGRTTKYWLVANSWGRHWGEDGMLRIRRGTNEADIERFVVSAWSQPMPEQMSDADNAI